MTVKVAPVFPASAPLTRNPKVPQKFRAVLWEQYLLPTVAENLSTLLGISVGFLPDSIVGATFEREADRHAGHGRPELGVADLDVHLLAEAEGEGARALERQHAHRTAGVRSHAAVEAVLRGGAAEERGHREEATKEAMHRVQFTGARPRFQREIPDRGAPARRACTPMALPRGA